MPVASLSPSPVIETTPTTIPTTAQARATGIAPYALSTMTVSILAGPMRAAAAGSSFVTTATTQRPEPRARR